MQISVAVRTDGVVVLPNTYLVRYLVTLYAGGSEGANHKYIMIFQDDPKDLKEEIRNVLTDKIIQRCDKAREVWGDVAIEIDQGAWLDWLADEYEEDY